MSNENTNEADDGVVDDNVEEGISNEEADAPETNDNNTNQTSAAEEEPWWKQKHVLIIGLTVLVIIVVVAIVLGVALSSSSNNNNNINNDNNASIIPKGEGYLLTPAANKVGYVPVKAYFSPHLTSTLIGENCIMGNTK